MGFALLSVATLLVTGGIIAFGCSGAYVFNSKLDNVMKDVAIGGIVLMVVFAVLGLVTA